MTINSLIMRIKSNDNQLTTLHYDDYQTAENNYEPLNTKDLALLTTALAENRFIVYVELAFDNLNKEEAICLASLFETNHRITSVFLNCENDIEPDGAIILAEAVEKNHSITWINFEGADINILEVKKRISKQIDDNCILAKKLRIAAKDGNLELAQQLVQAGASLNDKGDEGNTALHLSGLGHHRKISEYLLHQDNQVLLHNSYNQFPYLYMLPKDQLPQKCTNLTFFQPPSKESFDYFNDYDKLQKHLASMRLDSSVKSKPKF